MTPAAARADRKTVHAVLVERSLPTTEQFGAVTSPEAVVRLGSSGRARQ